MEEVMEASGTLLGSISDFCRRTGMAESTFGRRAVNDGKFVARLRDGARVTPETLQRVNLFVNTCSEKDVVARRVGLELGHIHPQPPAVRLFDAGMGDGTVLARVMREMHRRFPTVPFYIVGKEISLEDVRLSLRKMVDRFYEHPATVLVVTNMYYTEAPWLTPHAVAAATSMVWHEAALTGVTSHDFAEQIAQLEPFLAKNWQARHSPKTGNPVYDHPVALVVYRDDYRFLLDEVIPKRGRARAARIQGAEGDRAAGALSGQGRPAARHSFLRPRPRPGDHPARLAGREPVHAEPPRRPARHQERAGQGCAALQLQHLLGRALAVPLRHAYAAERDLRQHRHLDAVRGLERRDLRGADRRPATRRGAARQPLPRRDPRSAAKARQSLVPRRILCRFPQARLTLEHAPARSPSWSRRARSRSRRASCIAPRRWPRSFPPALAPTCLRCPGCRSRARSKRSLRSTRQASTRCPTWPRGAAPGASRCASSCSVLRASTACTAFSSSAATSRARAVLTPTRCRSWKRACSPTPASARSASPAIRKAIRELRRRRWRKLSRANGASRRSRGWACTWSRSSASRRRVSSSTAPRSRAPRPRSPSMSAWRARPTRRPCCATRSAAASASRCARCATSAPASPSS